MSFIYFTRPAMANRFAADFSRGPESKSIKSYRFLNNCGNSSFTLWCGESTKRIPDVKEKQQIILY